MRKRRFLAIAAAFAVSMTLTAAPVTVLATEPGEEYDDTVDDEQEEGEQTTVAEPGAEGGDAGSGTSGGGTSGGSSGNSTSSGSGSQSTEKSSDSSLSYLGISPGSLSPSFSSGTFEYTAAVDADVTSVSIPARTNSSKAVIASVTGAKSITPGTNTIKVVVEAENGSTSTYTITVQCGSVGASNASGVQSEDAPNTIEGEITDTELEGETTDADDQEEEPEEETSEITFDSNGYLIYEGNAYIPSELMPEGEYVSLDKYNSLYEQAQAEKTKANRLVIIFAVVLVVFISLIVGLVFKLRDVRQDAKLGILGADDEEPDDLNRSAAKEKKAPRARTKASVADTTMIPDVKLPEQTGRTGSRVAEHARTDEKAPEKPKAKAKASAKVPEKPKAAEKKAAKADEDLQILDLNDL